MVEFFIKLKVHEFFIDELLLKKTLEVRQEENKLRCSRPTIRKTRESNFQEVKELHFEALTPTWQMYPKQDEMEV